MLRLEVNDSLPMLWIVLASTLAACGAEAGGADARSPEVTPSAVPTAERVDTFRVTVDPSALPTSALDRGAFVEDACTFATAQDIAAFFTFDDGPVGMEGDDGFYAGSECAYALQQMDVFLEIQFSQTQASSTEQIELAGVSDVLRDVSASTLENRARAQLPFRIEGSPVERVVIQFHVRGVPPADEETLRTAIDALGTNLVERLGAGAFLR